VPEQNAQRDAPAEPPHSRANLYDFLSGHGKAPFEPTTAPPCTDRLVNTLRGPRIQLPVPE